MGDQKSLGSWSRNTVKQVSKNFWYLLNSISTWLCKTWFKLTRNYRLTQRSKEVDERWKVTNESNFQYQDRENLTRTLSRNEKETSQPCKDFMSRWRRSKVFLTWANVLRNKFDLKKSLRTSRLVSLKWKVNWRFILEKS